LRCSAGKAMHRRVNGHAARRDEMHRIFDAY
jgi:hypothetical protein